MKAVRQLGQLLAATIAFAPLVTAVAEPVQTVHAIVIRQDESTTTVEPSTTTTEESEETTTADETNTDETNTITTGTGTGTRTTATATTTDDDESTSTGRETFDATAFFGSVVMQTPALTSSILHMIEDPTPITFAWNYTSIQGTPTAIDVVASCSSAAKEYTITANMTWSSNVTLTWDTKKYAETNTDNMLVTEEYSLQIYDVDIPPDAQAEAGYLMPYSGTTFGLYYRQEYSNLSSGWQCVTCSAGRALSENQSLGFAMIMSTITVLSFTWYVVGFGAL